MLSRISIRRRLLVILITAIIICWSVSVWFVYLAAYREVEEIYDAALAQQARVLATLMNHEIIEEKKTRENLRRLADELGSETIESSPLLQKLLHEYLGSKSKKDYLTLLSREAVPGHRYESKIAFIVMDAEGKVMLRSTEAITAEDFVEGFSERALGRKVWRTFGLTTPGSHVMVQVGEKLQVRKETVKYIVLNSLWPLLVALPLFGLVIWLTVTGGLKPLRQVAMKVERRDPNSLVPISPEGVPQEVVPMVESLNRLFSRVQNALEGERRFTADAAHELRTPLAALKTMAQAKQLSDHQHEHSLFLEQIVKGVDRTTHLLEQLLTLARMDSQSEMMTDLQKVDLAELVIQVLSVLGEAALNKEIDLVCEGCDERLTVNAYAPALEILLRNLVDNAIRYTPSGGNVRVSLLQTSGETMLLIDDTGPGIPEDQMASMFQRFRRGMGNQATGSGLGLSIVQRIVELLHAEISLQNHDDKVGLRVCLKFST
jgi:two-component system, OmpR family, sensor histidine kinase QseC